MYASGASTESSIFATGLYELSHPPEHQVVLGNLHANVWWGAILLIFGAVLYHRFSPRANGPIAGNA